jgi:2-iminobutanoate/2-iminopropanoate deaminase
MEILMRKEIVHLDEVSDQNLPLSRVVCVDKLLYLSGMVSIDLNTGSPIHGTIEKETKQVLENIEILLKSANSSLDQVVKTTVYLRNINHFDEMNEVYKNYFCKNPPARTTVGIDLAGKFLIEIEAIAIR